MHRTSSPIVIAALLFTATVTALGYILLGVVPMLLFSLGFIGGFIAWLAVSARPPFASIRAAYFLTLALFVLHKFEERYLDFFPALAAITGVPVPEPDSIFVVALYAFALAWLLVPMLVSRGTEFGYYLAWTFFMSMGTVEIAHFFFPFFNDKPYHYFPGMLSALFLVPAAWWGMWHLSRRPTTYAM